MKGAVFYKNIRKKQRFAKKVCRDPEILQEICEQIEVCEGLCRPLTEQQIEELAQLSLAQIGHRLWTHKFA